MCGAVADVAGMRSYQSRAASPRTFRVQVSCQRSGRVLTTPATALAGRAPIMKNQPKYEEKPVPGEGFEPPTFGLQNRCTATVLTRQFQ
jgi:hypothetical protein